MAGARAMIWLMMGRAAPSSRSAVIAGLVDALLVDGDGRSEAEEVAGAGEFARCCSARTGDVSPRGRLLVSFVMIYTQEFLSEDPLFWGAS
jgi:hypothetical protein